MKRNEMDRPTKHSLSYLTSVRPHHIDRADVIIDEFAEECLKDLCGCDIIKEFKGLSRSRYTIEGHYQNLWNYDRKIQLPPDDQLLLQALEQTRQAFKLPQRVRPLSWNALREVPFISSSGAGYGYIGKKGDPGNLELAISRAVFHLNMWKEGIQMNDDRRHRYTPDLAWTRTQLGPIQSPKIRNVWGEAFHNILIEGINAVPLMKAYQNGDFPIVTGMHIYKKLPALLYSVLQSDTINAGVGIDFSKFDSSIQPWLIKYAFDILRENIDFSNAVTEELCFDYSMQYFIERPIVMPDGRMWYKRLGIPSGSYFTQLIGSIANHIVITYIQLVLYGQTFRTYVLGDDSIFGIPIEYGYPDLNKMAEIALTLGLTINTDKSIVASRPNELTFLGHSARMRRVSREDAELIALSLFTEHPVLGPRESYSRIVGLLLDSALNSWPLINLFQMANIKLRQMGTDPPAAFSQADSHWIQSVSNLPITPSSVDIVKAFLLT